MKGLTIAAFLTAALMAALMPVAGTLYGEVFPDDPAKRQALQLCRNLDPGFSRFLAASRAACYQRFLGAAPGKPGASPAPGHEARRSSGVS